MATLSVDMLKTKLSLINWQYHLTKWVLIGLLVTAWTYHWYDKGRTECENAAATAALQWVVQDVKERLPVVQQAERGAAELRQEVKTIKEKLDAQADKPAAADCSLNDEQLQLFRTLSEKTQR